MNNTQFFLLRRLHSLVGAMAVGLFLVEHIFTNAFIMNGAEAYNSQIAFLQKLPFLHAIEIVFIAMPLAFHAIYGIFITFTARLHPLRYNYGANWRYVFQRITGVIALVFIILHVYNMRFVQYPSDHDFYRVVAETMSQPGAFIWYAIGLASSIFHFVNGIWTALIVWGITVNVRTQQVCLWGCYLIGLLMFGAGMASLVSASPLF